MLTDTVTEPHDEHRLRPITGFLFATFPPKRAGRREASSLRPLRTSKGSLRTSKGSERPESPRSRRLLPTLIPTSAEDSLICIFEVLPDEFLKLGQALKPIPASLSGSSRACSADAANPGWPPILASMCGNQKQVFESGGGGGATRDFWGPHHCSDAFRDRRKRRRSGF